MLRLLTQGEIELAGLMPRASNYTFAVTVADGEMRALAVYKPEEGESPLWDFPEGLWRREIAAYEVACAMGWDFVPPTIEREGPHGLGSVQLMIDAEPGEHYFTLMPANADVFRRVAAFDLVANNADRKGGHCLLEHATGRIWVVDHGVCFHAHPKLRTVIWDFAGEPFSDEVGGALDRLCGVLDGPLGERLRGLLDPAEVDAVGRRARGLVAGGRYPDPPEDRRAVPWPPI